MFLFSWNYQYKLLLGETVIVTLYTVEGVGGVGGGLGVNKTTTDSVYAVHFVIILLLLGG